MSVIGQIRKKPWVLMGVVIIALLAFLINPDSLNKIFGKNPNILGKVNGEEITREEYSDALLMLQSQAEQQGRPTTGLEEQAWQNLVQSKLIKQEFEKLGLKLTEDYFWSQLPYDPLFAQNPEFNVQEFKKEIEKARTDGSMIEQYNAWLRARKEIEYRMMARQVFGNITAGITSNKKEAETIMKQRDEVADIDYVKVDYTTFAQKNPIKVTTPDLADYIKKHPTMFKVPESRNLGIVYFLSQPSAEDDAAALAEINKLYQDGVETGSGIESFKNNKNDSLFVLAHSETGFNPNYFEAGQLPEGIRNQVAGAAIGQTFGPYKEQNYYVVSKLLGKKTTDSIRSRHILISYQGLQGAQGEAAKRTKEQAKELAEKITAEVKSNPAKFEEYLKLSADGSSQNGGDLGWIVSGRAQFVPTFQSYIENNPKGAVGLVESQYGYHIINVTDKKLGVGAVTYKIANLTKEIKPSDATTNKAHAQSTTFAQQVQGKSFNEFANLAKKGNYNYHNPKMVQRFQGILQGGGTDKDEEVIRWAFDSKRKKGDTEMFTTAGGDRIVVYFNEKYSEGLADPETVREQIEPIVKNQLLAKEIIKKISAVKTQDLGAIANLFGVSKESGQINLLNPVIGGAIEPKVAGAAFGAGKNKVSQPVQGNSGVYVVINKGVNVNKQPGSVKEITQALVQQNAGIFPQAFMRSLQNSADIEDYRIEVYNTANSGK